MNVHFPNYALQHTLLPGEAVTLNPQPLPPRWGDAVSLNPQPLPPRVQGVAGFFG
jgi:hypothetical protein